MNNWQRLEQLIKWTGMSTNAFALSIGLKRSENLYQIKRGNFGISKELARLIIAKYPMINRSWLLSGDGDMFIDALICNPKEMNLESIHGTIPFFQADIINVALDRQNQVPLYNMVLPMFKGASFAAPCHGTSMEPAIPHGSTVVVREVDINAVLPGEIFLAVTPDFVVLRRVRYVEGDECSFRLIAENREQFDDIIIKRDAINKIYLVTGVLISRHM